MIINIGASYLAFSQVESNKKQLINVKIMGEERSSICFESSNFLEKPIHIGRCITCDLRLDDNLLSKVHSTLYHSPSGWYLIDGDQEKRSTNGTWLYLTEDLEMYSGMIFKCNQSVFQVLSLSEEHLT